MTREDLVKEVLAGRPANAAATAAAQAPANIALIKYWGKRDPELNLPVTDSLSVSLGEFGTHTSLTLTAGPGDQVTLNGERLAADSQFVSRVSRFLDLFRPAGAGFRVATHNTIPTAAGLASSASGYAALVKALDRLFAWNLPPRDLSILARLGSGSACRSVVEGFVHWHAGERADGLDSFAERLPVTWPDLRVGLVLVATEPKPVSSRDGMNRTTAASDFYPAWPARAAADLAAIQPAIAANDLPQTGRIAEANALAMHATMLAARPPLLYWRPQTVAVFEQVRHLRRDGVQVYFTIDAGPNVKLLFTAAAEDRLRTVFPTLETAAPFRLAAGNHT